MSRVIKFRAWDSQRSIMLDSVNINDERAVEQGYQWITQPTPAVYLKLMQFTGFNDKNGVDIYEGDIVNHRLQGPREVIYPMSDTYAGYGLLSSTGKKNTMNDTEILYEVIGNIHQNPDLLK